MRLAVYVHWPFCRFKCPYCDFNSHVRDSVDHDAWRRAYVRELGLYRELTGPREIVSVFFGGGTPSLMEPSTVESVIGEIDRLWGVPQGTEVTLEANPTSAEAGRFRDFRAAGINRVSVGVQSLRDADLRRLGRQHSAAEGLAAVKMASDIFERFSFDLIYAREGQTPADWRAELAEALPHARSHLSMYQLTIEEGTQYHTLFSRGELTIPEEDAAAEMYEITQDMTAARGLDAYEVSNHARFGDESRHNLVYWTYGDYIGAGPGAHGRFTMAGKKFASRAHRAPEVWLEKVAAAGHGAHPFEELAAESRGREMLMMGLRLTEGVGFAAFAAETGRAFSDFVNPERVKMLVDHGLLAVTAERVAATPAGRRRLNAVLSYLLN